MRRDYINLNKNILIGFGVSLLVSAAVAELLSDQADDINTTYTIIIDGAVYYSVFSGLYYLDYRKKYRLESGEIDTKRLRPVMAKLIIALALGQVAYNIARWGLQHDFLTLDYDHYLASMVSHTLSLLVYMAVVNLCVKVTRLYRDG